MRALLGSAVFLFPILSSSAASPPASAAPQEPIRIGVSSMITPVDTVKYYQAIIDYIGARIGQPVRMVHRRTYEEMDGLLERGEVKIAFICSAPYVKDRERFGVELEFMCYLVFREIEALETSDLRAAGEFVEKQERFSGEFLRRWIPPFCERIKENTENGFYAALAQCASTFIASSRPADLRAAAGEGPMAASR